MNLYLITPRDDGGGSDMDQLVLALSAIEAVRLYHRQLAGDDGAWLDVTGVWEDCFRTEELWRVRQLPPARSFRNPRVVAWEECLMSWFVDRAFWQDRMRERGEELAEGDHERAAAGLSRPRRPGVG